MGFGNFLNEILVCVCILFLTKQDKNDTDIKKKTKKQKKTPPHSYAWVRFGPGDLRSNMIGFTLLQENCKAIFGEKKGCGEIQHFHLKIALWF